MISWGTKYDLLGETYDFEQEQCQICNETDSSLYKVEQGYFNLYGLSLFPTSKKYYKICPSCKIRLKVKSTDGNLAQLKKIIPGKLKFKYVWGWLILGPVLFGLIYLIYSIKMNA